MTRQPVTPHEEKRRQETPGDELPAALRAEPSGATLVGLRERLLRTAREAKLLDIVFHTVDSPVGKLLLTRTPRGMLRIAFEVEGHDQVLQELAETVSPRIMSDPNALDPACRQLEAYFTGKQRDFDLPVDLQLVGGFRRRVVDELSRLDYGRTASYAQIAVALGNPRASRAVGTACAHNPLPIVIGCHRVVRSDGHPGNYLGGAEVKQRLLQLESQLNPTG